VIGALAVVETEIEEGVELIEGISVLQNETFRDVQVNPKLEPAQREQVS